MLRLHGDAPYRVVLVHGGPGAIGSLKGFAGELSRVAGVGVVEAIQSRYSVGELIEELHDQIGQNCCGKIVLVGHSWGAWLAALYAQKYPGAVEQLALVGCPPLTDEYVAAIGQRRLENLSAEDGEVFLRLVSNQATEQDMQRIPVIFERADNYQLQNREAHRADRTDSEMHNKVWREAAEMRGSGELLAAFRQIQCRIYLLQGDSDPHPAEGVVVPLRENGVECESHVLSRCGHSPFMEVYAKDVFYRILTEIIGK